MAQVFLAAPLLVDAQNKNLGAELLFPVFLLVQVHFERVGRLLRRPDVLDKTVLSGAQLCEPQLLHQLPPSFPHAHWRKDTR